MLKSSREIKGGWWLTAVVCDHHYQQHFYHYVVLWYIGSIVNNINPYASISVKLQLAQCNTD